MPRFVIFQMWNIKEENCEKEFSFSKHQFEITALCHPPTYSDKILFGSKQGALQVRLAISKKFPLSNDFWCDLFPLNILQLWNIKANKKLYKFIGWCSPVTCLEPCPSVLDAVAIGLESGQIIVHNIKFDEKFVSFKQVIKYFVLIYMNPIYQFYNHFIRNGAPCPLYRSEVTALIF